MTIQEFEDICLQMKLDLWSGYIVTNADDENDIPPTVFRYYHRGYVLNVEYSTLTGQWSLAWKPFMKPLIQASGSLEDLRLVLGR